MSSDEAILLGVSLLFIVLALAVVYFGRKCDE